MWRPRRRPEAGLAVLLALAAWSPPLGAAEQGRDCAWPEAPVRRSLALESDCIYRDPLVIDRSDVAVDCRGARIEPGGQHRDAVTIGVEAGVRRVSLRNCTITGARRSGIRIGWRYPPRQREQDFTAEERQERAPRDVVIERVTISRPAGVGIYVESYVQDTRILDSRIEGAGAVGLYLDAGSRGTVVSGNVLRGNGFGTADSPRQGLGRREGIAVDSSAGNVIRDNLFERNGVGGVLLYRNCGERTGNPDNAFTRWQGSTGNVIEGNRFVDEVIGVWLGSRQSRVLRGMGCSMAYYGQGRFMLDDAGGNRVQRNDFTGTRIGVLAEDDDQTIHGNRFTETRETCVLAGTAPRSLLLRRPRGYVAAYGARIDEFEGNAENGGQAELQAIPCAQERFPFSDLARGASGSGTGC